MEQNLKEPNLVQRNYAKEFFTSDHSDYSVFFNKEADKEIEIVKQTAKLKQLKEDLESADAKLAELYAAQYLKNFTPETRPIILSYAPKNQSTVYWTYPGAALIDSINDYDDKNPIYINLPTKNTEIDVPCGFAMTMGSVVAKKYKISINGNNDKLDLKLKDTLIIGLLEPKCANKNGEVLLHEYELERLIPDTNASSFINNFFGVNKNISLTLGEFAKCYKNNKSAELIIKTSPDELVAPLLKINISENKPIYQILGMTKEGYTEGVKRGLTWEMLEMRHFISNPIFNMNNIEWLDLIQASKQMEIDLDYYAIQYGQRYYYNSNGVKPDHTRLIFDLAYAYEDETFSYINKERVFATYYSFRHFVEYVVRECINQGQTRLATFYGLLNDYLKMAHNNQVEPILYSSMLSINHDQLSRNVKIKADAETEQNFQAQYKDFKEVILQQKYKMIAPKCTKDLVVEGSRQGNCVASYVRDVALGKTKVLFLRKIEDLKESWITVEVKNGKITQFKKAMNGRPNRDEMALAAEYAKKAGLIYEMGSY